MTESNHLAIGPAVVVAPSQPELSARAAQIAAHCALPLRPSLPEQGYALVVAEERVVLQQMGEGAPGPVFVDFVGGAVGHRRRFGGGRGQPIAKAVGLRGGRAPRVLDATAGLGRDAFVFASLGCDVTLVERSAVVRALLEDGLKRAAEDAAAAPIAARMRLVGGDGISVLAGLPAGQAPDVIYLDPMYPHRQKSALVKKEMRLFQAVVGADADADHLLEAALRTARFRVVVKRPDDAPPLAERKPTLSISTKRHRFDVYVLRSMDRMEEGRGD